MYTLTKLHNDLIQFTRALEESYEVLTVYLEFTDEYLDEYYTKKLKKRVLNLRITTLLKGLTELSDEAKTLSIDKQLELYDYFNSFALDVINRSGGITYYIPLTVDYLRNTREDIVDYTSEVRRRQIQMIRNVRKDLNKKP